MNTQIRPPLNVAELQQFLESLRSYSGGFIFAREGRRLYHYTDLGGLAGIIDRHDLWLTHLRYSNDNEELQHGLRVADRILAESMAKQAKSSPGRRVLERVQSLLASSLASAVYVTCFCTKDNLLGQWRGYAGNGAGVSLAIDPFGFAEVAGQESVGFLRLWKVFYDIEKQNNIARNAIRRALSQRLGEDTRVWRLYDALQFFIPTFKHPDFRDEEEYRLIFTPQPDAKVQPHFRVARGMLVPYISLRDILRAVGVEMPRLPIKEVRVGPSTHRDLNVMSTRLLLERGGYKEVPVQMSDTPYRG